MDGVALVLAFEEEFGVAIPGSAAEKMRTPRDVIDFVVMERRRVQKLDAQLHLASAFADLGFADIRPDLSFNELFGNQRVMQWKELGKRLAPFSIPPDVACGPGGAVAVWSFLAGLIALFLRQWVLTGVCAFLCCVGWLWAGRMRRIPNTVDTLEKLCAHLTRPISNRDIADTVKKIVIEQLGLKDGIYGEDKRFIEDLGMD